MNPSNQGSNYNQRSEWSSASSSSNREEEFAARQRYHAQPQHGLNVAAMPNNHDNIFPRYADHTYRDFSTYIKEGNRIEKHKKSDRNFPARLHAMLSDRQYSHIISWMPHGRAWKVNNKELLMEEAAPKFFGQSKYASFARQLSGWGFKRLHQTGPDFGCYYHECFLRGHPKLTALMRRVPPGQGKVTPNMHAEPDFYTIAEQYPLETAADVDVPNRDNQRPLKIAKASVSGSGRQKSDRPSDFDRGDQVAGYKEDDDPLLTRKATAPSMETMSNQHQWDPFDHEVDSAHFPPHPHHPEAATASAMNQYAGANHLFAERSGQSQSFASMDGTKGTETNAQARQGMKYNPYPESLPQSGSYRDRGYSDPFPEPNHHMDPHSGYSMHQAQQECYGSNVNQYAAHQQYAAGYYYPPPHHSQPQSQQHDVHSHNNMPNHYWHRNPYYDSHSYHVAQGMAHAQGYAQAQAANSAQPQYLDPAEAQGDCGHSSPRPLPNFSPMKPCKEGEEESDSKPRT